MQTIQIQSEDFYNASGYADFLDNPLFHHSDKGCEIKMDIMYGNRNGEESRPSIVKKCLTHGVICSKTGWEQGYYLGYKSLMNVCSCGAELEDNGRLCKKCKLEHLKNSQEKYYNNKSNQKRQK